jgi:predicted nucleic acid-binding protein
MAEITLIKAITSQQVIREVERNLEDKIPAALTTFRMLVSRCLEVVPYPSLEEVQAISGSADPKDLPILAAANTPNCQFLTTYNIKHFQPGIKTVTVLAPGDLVQRVRYLLASI